MLSTQMMKLAERNQWKSNTEEQTVFGEFNGYLFTGLEGKGFKAFITPLAGISQEGLQALVRFLNENSKTLRLRNFETADNFLCIRMQEGLLPLSADKMEYLLAQVSGLLSQYDLPTSVCAVCGEPATRKGLYYGFFCYLHPECQDREIVEFIRLPENEPADDNVFELVDDQIDTGAATEDTPGGDDENSEESKALDS